MRHLRLTRLASADEKALADDSDYQSAMAEGDWTRLASAVQRIVGSIATTAPSVDAAPPEWGGYFAIDDTTNELVGSCAFKAPPNSEGLTEIAYFTYPGFEGRGYATLMAGRLVELAKTSSQVHRVIAHTLPETNASTRVLEKVGMHFAGEVIEPDDGRVWRWELQVGV
jgi:[ribosomal protein S5]-alanine N-acetyltransferase